MTWKQLSSRTVFDNDWITVLEDEVINPNGGRNQYGRIHFKNRAIGIVPLAGNDDTWLVGHRDTHFRFLAELEAGDELELETADGDSVIYTVTELAILDGRSAGISLDEGVARLTLVTCYPFDAPRAGGSLRYVVTAVRADTWKARPATVRRR